MVKYGHHLKDTSHGRKCIKGYRDAFASMQFHWLLARSLQICANGGAEEKLQSQLHTLLSYYFEVTMVQKPKLSRKKIRKVGSGVPLMKNHTIPHASFVELAAKGDCEDRQHRWIQKESQKLGTVGP